MQAVRNWIADHKKLTITILGALVGLLPDKYVDQAHKDWIMAQLMAFVIGQGIADHGKEAAKIEAASRNADPKAV